MAASAAAQQAAHAEAEQQLIERLKTVEAALSEARESEQSLRVCTCPANCYRCSRYEGKTYELIP